MKSTVDTSRARALLNLDSIGGLLVGAVVLSLQDMLAEWHGLPVGVLVFTGIMNLVYGSFSGSLALFARLKKRMPARVLVSLLILANFCWLFVCLYLLVQNRETVTGLGAAHLGLEGLYVAGLAIIEARVVRPLTK